MLCVLHHTWSLRPFYSKHSLPAAAEPTGHALLLAASAEGVSSIKKDDHVGAVEVSTL